MTVFIIPILIRAGAFALEKAAGGAIARWAGGSIVKQYIATTVAKKAIDEARKMSLGESKDWSAAFKADPGEALRGAAVDFVNTEIRGAFGKTPKINERLIDTFKDDLIGGIGQDIQREANKEIIGEPLNVIMDFDPDRLIERTSENIIAKGLEWSENKEVIDNSPSSNILNRSVIGGSSAILNRSVIGGSSQIEDKSVIEEVDRIETKDLLESAGKTAFYDSFSPEALTYTVIGTDDALRGKVMNPIEAIAKQVFDTEVRSL